MNDQSTPTKHDLAALEKLAIEGESVDADIFAEMRSNLLLIAGEHYNRRTSSFFRRVRDSKDLNDQQKLRLTKNHIQKIHKIYCNNILSFAPGVGFEPKDPGSVEDQTKAEIHHAVWQDALEKYDLDEATDDWCDSFNGVGEVHVKIFWDPMAGKIVAYKQKIDEEQNPVFLDEGGEETYDQVNAQGLTNPLAPGEPVFEGQFVFEEIYGMNLLRAAESKDMRKSPFLTIRKMVEVDDLKAKYPEAKSKIVAGMDGTMIVFDGARATYRKQGTEALVKETYFRPCPQYPKGYYYIFTKEVLLEEGELPAGVFPIVSQPYEKVQTSCRGRGPVKQMRPYQIEINRAASKIAEHQITLGDDKILVQNGTKVSAGVALPGVRSINFTGMEPVILAGRDGSQYLAYMQSQIEELYAVMNVAEDEEELPNQDPYLALFKAASKKKKFQRYAHRFERFLINVAKVYIKLAKYHFDDKQFILAAGSKEQVNIKEFKNMDDLCYEVKVDAESEDLETKFGRQLMINHLIQYSGSNMSKEDIGKLIRLSPYANMEEGTSDLTIDFDNANNMILALDRGETPQVSQYDDPAYMARRLVSRMRQADFRFKDQQIQNNYGMLVQQFENLQAMQMAQKQRAEAGFIPTDGYMVVCDLYVDDPAKPGETRRARIPYSSLQWLITKLEDQGQDLQTLETMNQGQMAEMTQHMLRNQGQGGNGMPPGQNRVQPGPPAPAQSGQMPPRMSAVPGR